jgi:antitoxin (DNA-binding transcriptional repressor) of toxin-antitoxin stability system
MKTITIREAREGLSHPEQLFATDDEVIVTRRGEPVARILPIKPAKPKPALAGGTSVASQPRQTRRCRRSIAEDREDRGADDLHPTPARWSSAIWTSRSVRRSTRLGGRPRRWRSAALTSSSCAARWRAAAATGRSTPLLRKPHQRRVPPNPGWQRPVDENRLIAERREKLAAWRATGKAFPNDFSRENLAGKLDELYSAKTREELEATPIEVKVAGRIMLKRVMGKASFASIQDVSGRIQIFVSNDITGEDAHKRLQGLGPGRHRRLRRHAVQDQDRRTDRAVQQHPPADQVAAPAAGEIPRPDRRRAEVPRSATST